MNTGLNLKLLEQQLNSAIASGGDLPTSINEAIMTWLGANVMGLLWTALIFVVFAFVFYGAFLYFTAYGDDNRMQLAKKSITYAFVGLIIGVLALGITTYVRNILVEKDYGTTPTTTAPGGSGTGTGTGRPSP